MTSTSPAASVEHQPALVNSVVGPNVSGKMGASSIMIKYSSLLLLTVQNVMLIIFMRYSRTRPGDQYTMTTAVVVAEVFKLTSCLVIIFVQEKSINRWFHHLNHNIFSQPMDCLKISVPGIIYMVQNNLLYIAVANLEAATYQVIYQLKILTTALFSVAMLRKQLSKIQWFALLILFMGVGVIVQLQTEASKPHSTTKTTAQSTLTQQNPILGLAAVLISCVLSGFAGVYFEKILKNTPQSLYVRNVQLGFFGIVFGLGAVFISDGQKIADKGFFFGYDIVVWTVIFLQSFGGILVAVVVKYADNILKGFATSAAIVLSCVVSMFFFNFEPSLQFACGTVLVIFSVYLYSKYVPALVVKKKTTLSV